MQPNGKLPRLVASGKVNVKAKVKTDANIKMLKIDCNSFNQMKQNSNKIKYNRDATSLIHYPSSTS